MSDGPWRHKQYERVAIQFVHNGFIEIDAEGRIWRIARLRWCGRFRDPKMCQCERKRAERLVRSGYLIVQLCHERRMVTVPAHRIVYQFFHGDIPQGMTVNHEDGCKTNNHPKNLVLATYPQQAIHVITVLGRNRSSLTESDVHEIRRLHRSGEKMRSIGERYGVSEGSVFDICSGRRWAHVKSDTHCESAIRAAEGEEKDQ